MIVNLYKLGRSLTELSAEYGFTKSAMNGLIDKKKKIDDNEVITKQEIIDIK